MPSYKKISNKWSVVFDLPTDGEKRIQKRLSGYPSRRDAELAFIAYRGENKVIKPVGKETAFAETYSKYKTYKDGQVKESTLITLDDCFRLHILPYFKDIQITDITADTCADWRDWLRNKQGKGSRLLSVSSVNSAQDKLGSFFKYCEDFDLIEKSPLRRIKKLRDDKRHKTMNILTAEQFRAFIEKETDIEYATLFWTLYLTGLRIGEALSLKWLDLRGNELNVNKSLTRATKEKTEIGRRKITDTKYKDSDRVILLSENLLSRLLALKEHYRALVGFSENNYIFGNYTPLPHQSVKNHKDRACDVINIPRIRIHDFRHSHASYLIAKGMDIVTIAKRLGHKDIKETLNTYAHLMPNKQIEMLGVLNSV